MSEDLKEHISNEQASSHITSQKLYSVSDSSVLPSHNYPSNIHVESTNSRESRQYLKEMGVDLFDVQLANEYMNNSNFLDSPPEKVHKMSVISEGKSKKEHQSIAVSNNIRYKYLDGVPIGSLLFLFGFLCCPLWWYGAFMKRKDKNDEFWAHVNRGMSIFSLFLLGFIIGLLIWYAVSN